VQWDCNNSIIGTPVILREVLFGLRKTSVREKKGKHGPAKSQKKNLSIVWEGSMFRSPFVDRHAQYVYCLAVFMWIVRGKRTTGRRKEEKEGRGFESDWLSQSFMAVTGRKGLRVLAA